MRDPSAEEVYSSPQINIPATFPFILKQYAKAAIRTQPYDLLRWSASYFRALAKGEEPPIKDRLEYPPPDTPSGLSPGYLKVLIKQIGKGGIITTDQLLERWNGICLSEESLQEMLAVGQFGETFDWLHFVAVAAGFLSNNLTQTMVLLCNLLTDEPDVGSAMIPLQTFTKLYTFLASLDCGGPEDHDDNENHEYVITEGRVDHVGSYIPEPALIKRESVESCSTDPSIYKVNWESHSAHQLFMENQSPFPSPQTSRPCTPFLDMAKASSSSTSTLTSQNQYCIIQMQGNQEESHQESKGTKLEMFYDAQMKDDRKSCQGLILEGNKTDVTEVHQKLSENSAVPKNGKSISFKQQKIVDEPKLMSSASEPSAEYSTSKCISSLPAAANGSGDLNEKENSLKTSKGKKSGDIKTHQGRHVPGIGPIVDAIQLQAVIDYLEGVALKQEGMVKPSNIRHFLCPPLEKVPASQRTRV